MTKCKHDTEYPLVLLNGNINCLTCGARLATTFAGSNFGGTDPEIIPVRRSNWSNETLTKALDKQAKPIRALEDIPTNQLIEILSEGPSIPYNLGPDISDYALLIRKELMEKLIRDLKQQFANS